MSQIKRLMFSVAIGGFSVLLAVLLVVVFFPATLLPVVGMVTPYTVKADKVEISLFSPRAYLEQFSLYSEQDKLIAKARQISVASVADDGWEAMIIDADVFVEHFPDTQNLESKGSENKSSKGESTASNEAIDIYGWLSTLALKLENIQAHINQDERIHIDYLRSLSLQANQPKANSLKEGQPKEKQAGVDFSVNYKTAETVFPVQGQLLSSNGNEKNNDRNAPQLTLLIPSLDLRSLIPTTDSNNKTASTPSVETVMSWAWISSIAPLDVAFQSNNLQLEQGKVSDLELLFSFVNDEKPIISQSHRGHVALTITPDYAINTPFSLESSWKVLGERTTGADVEGATTLIMGDNQFSVDGLLNLNGISGNQWQVTSDVAQFPLLAESTVAKAVKNQSQPLFPFNLQTKLVLIDQQVSLSDMVMQAGQSDIKGRVDFDLNKSLSALDKIVFSLASKKLVIPSVPSNNTNKKEFVEELDNKKSSKYLFSDEPLPLDLFDLFTVEGELTVAQLIYGDRLLLAGFANTIVLKDNRLSVNSKAENFADGKLDSTIEITKQGQQLQLIVDSSVSDALLESLALLPKDEFSGGKTNLSVSLQGTGHSTKSLASSLNGDLLLVTRKGTIGNNSFEIIGSDLILNLINSINPFHKKVNTTELECAVVKSKIENGRLLFDKSLEVKTSKMIVVADGFVDLSSEKINLGINPKARKGVGVDIASLAKFVALQGTLSDPKLGASAGGTLKSLASVGAAMSTGGLSLLASGLLDKATAEQGCARALAAFNTAEKS